MKTTIGIITLNRPQTLRLVLEALGKQTRDPFEIIVADNSTGSDTQELLKQYPGVVNLRIRERLYQPHLRNIILNHCRGEVIAFLDDDAVPKPKWLESIEEGYLDREVAGVTGPAINCESPGNATVHLIHPASNRNYFTPSGDMRSDARRWIPPHPVKCTVMLGANMSYRTELIRRIRFDEFYGRDAAFREESDPQVAIIREGYSFLYHPGAFVWHMCFRQGGTRVNPRKDYYYHAGVNHRYFADKYFPRWRSRMAWIFWSVNPPCAWLALALAILRRDVNILKWHRGLWGR
jgi:glycosyltransferase involved in cell wall biosynthesis